MMVRGGALVPATGFCLYGDAPIAAIKREGGGF
jgi:hypothetical protein